jgi:hypothetical protein
VAGAAAAAVVVAYLVIAAAAHAFPFAKPAHPIAQPTIPVTPIHQTTPASSPASTPATSPASGIATLTQLLPAGIPASACSDANPTSYNFAIVGSKQVLSCQKGNWSVVAFQMDSSADYATTWQNFNKWIGHQPSSAGSTCPPGSSGQGTVPWSNKYFPQRNGQSLECGTYYSGGTPFPAYAWSFPTEDTFMWVLGNAGTSWSELDTWWKANQTQATAPSPPAS